MRLLPTAQVVVPESAVAAIPDSLGFETAAAVPCVGLAAWQCLDAASLAPGQRVLIHAGSGGVGSFAIQVGRGAGGLGWVGATPAGEVGDKGRGGRWRG